MSILKEWFTLFAGMAKEAIDAADFMERVRAYENVPPEVSKYFYDTYGEGGALSALQASENYIAAVKPCTLKEVHYDLRILEADKKHLVHCIDTGDWADYKEALAARRANLKTLNVEIEKLKSILEIL